MRRFVRCWNVVCAHSMVMSAHEAHTCDVCSASHLNHAWHVCVCVCGGGWVVNQLNQTWKSASNVRGQMILMEHATSQSFACKNRRAPVSKHVVSRRNVRGYHHRVLNGVRTVRVVETGDRVWEQSLVGSNVDRADAREVLWIPTHRKVPLLWSKFYQMTKQIRLMTVMWQAIHGIG